MNDFLQLVASRQSDRAYDMSRAVEPEKLERILEAARLSPSACNAQPWRFVVITDPELSVKVGKATAGLGMNKFAKDAPIHILVVEESMNITSFLGAKIKDKYFPLIDIGIITVYFQPWSTSCKSSIFAVCPLHRCSGIVAAHFAAGLKCSLIA